ncbi:dermonecrotic toxin SPH-like [Ixodes scapularis]|uniref:dermonecrotic toxin SPH-like n=1 Tax=Ixodes scapularis TaxID=6945 RepID=UPI001A9D7FD9|nr:dermonecrotic toxin SPH-like [Ixodes scapularis]
MTTLLLFAILPLLLSQELRPIYNIAHMVNSKEQVSEFMEKGANAIEFDVQFYDNGTAYRTYHGIPCDCFRICTKSAEIEDYFDYIRNLTISGGKYYGKLLLLMLDLKSSDVSIDNKLSAGADIASKLMDHLWINVPFNEAVNIYLSIGHVTDKDVLRGAVQAIQQRDAKYLDRIGFDVGLGDSLEDIRDMYRELNISGHRWLGDGDTNCYSFLLPTTRLEAAIADRKANNATSFVDKVYFWTTDSKTTIRKVLRLGVDGIITNHPEYLSAIIEEEEFKKTLRLASTQDNPFMRIP